MTWADFSPLIWCMGTAQEWEPKGHVHTVLRKPVENGCYNYSWLGMGWSDGTEQQHVCLLGSYLHTELCITLYIVDPVLNDLAKLIVEWTSMASGMTRRVKGILMPGMVPLWLWWLPSAVPRRRYNGAIFLSGVHIQALNCGVLMLLCLHVPVVLRSGIGHPNRNSPTLPTP